MAENNADDRNDGDGSDAGTGPEGWQSDVIADLIKHYDFPFIPLNPGASFRGLHDSLVNHNGDDPPMIICQHEKVAIQIAHGYAKVTGRPLVAIVHNVVGLLQSLMGVYCAYMDRVPVFIIGATGPMAEGKRRPRIDWTHTAYAQGEALRNFVKWEYQPGDMDGVVNSFARAYSIMMTEPRGPVYMCYDAGMQEAPLVDAVRMPSPDATRTPTRLAPDRDALSKAADTILQAQWPVLMPEFVGRVDTGMRDLTDLAETLGAPVADKGMRLNFAPQHPLDLRFEPEAFRRADLIVGLDLRNWEQPTHGLDPVTRERKPYYAETCRWLDIGFGDIEISKWAMDYQKFPEMEQRILADTSIAIPQLTELCRERISGDAGLQDRIETRRAEVIRIHDANRSRWKEEAKENRDASPISLARLASEVWEAIKNEDWVLTAEPFGGWAHKLWEFDKPYRHPGISLGTGTQIGMALGVALAHKGTGRIVVDCQPDGDLLFDAGALWIAARYRIPLLIVMHNNRAYYNDWAHQISIARQRSTPVERAHIGMDLCDPAPDFATLARSFGWYAEGPITDPGDIAGALARGIEQVKQGKPALIDTITRHKG